jgi:hypothetical protein
MAEVWHEGLKATIGTDPSQQTERTAMSRVRAQPRRLFNPDNSWYPLKIPSKWYFCSIWAKTIANPVLVQPATFKPQQARFLRPRFPRLWLPTSTYYSQTPLYFLTGIYVLELCTLGVNPSYGSVEDVLKSYSTSADTFPAVPYPHFPPPVASVGQLIVEGASWQLIPTARMEARLSYHN